jgi:hypothetical protein
MTAFSKYAAQTQRQYYEQFKHDAQEMCECRLVSIDYLLTAPISDLEMGPLCGAFVKWSAAAYQMKPGDGPHCLRRRVRTGPDSSSGLLVPISVCTPAEGYGC